MNAAQETVRNVYIGKNMPHVVSIPHMDDILEDENSEKCLNVSKEQTNCREH